MLDPMDYEATEKAEAQIDIFINARSKAREKANAEEAMYAEAVRRFNQRRQRRVAQERYDFHGQQLASHEATFGQLAAYHRGERARYAQILGIAVDEERDDSPQEAT